MSYHLVHPLRLRSSLMDCDIAQLPSFHYGKLLAMNNLTAASGSSSCCEGAFTPNLTAPLNPMFGHDPLCHLHVHKLLTKLQLNFYVHVFVIITWATMTLFFIYMFFAFTRIRSQSLLQVIILIADLHLVFYNLPQGSPFLSVCCQCLIPFLLPCRKLHRCHRRSNVKAH